MSAGQRNELVGGEATALHRHGQAGLEDAAVTAAKLGYAPDAIVLVQRGLTDAESGENLLAAYAAAQQLRPGGQDRSIGNRVCVLLPPGRYDLPTQTGAALTLPEGTGEYVDLVGMTPFNPVATIVTSAGGEGTGETIRQAAVDVRLANFTIENYGSAVGNHAFAISVATAESNAASQYRLMRFVQPLCDNNCCPVYAFTHLAGTWENCQSDDYGWRLAANVNVTAKMTECVGGNYCFTSSQANTALTGTFTRCTAGRKSFGGETSAGCTCSGTFTDCTAGDNSFGVGRPFSGTARRCTGGNHCFGGYSGSGTNYGSFTGYAEDCTAGGNSFGGGHASCVCSGKLVRCRNVSMTQPLYLSGAQVSNCDLKVTATNKHGLVLNDSNSRLYNCTIVTDAAGSGKSVYADAKDLVAAHCRANTAFTLNGGNDVLGAAGANVIHTAITL
jgi:hypothetical protein